MAKSRRVLKIAGISVSVLLVGLFTCIIAVICGSLAVAKIFPKEFEEASTSVALTETEVARPQLSTTPLPSHTNLRNPTKTSTEYIVDPSLIPTATSKPTEKPSPTYTQVPATSTPRRTNTPIATEELTGLPGLNPADLTINLEDNGLECTNAQSISGGYIWTCERDTISFLMRVDIYSFSTILSVDYVDAGIIFFTDPDNDLAASFLGFVATAPYDNADPSAARNWVETTLPTITEVGDIREAEFGGVEFLLFGDPSARFLEYGDLGEDY